MTGEGHQGGRRVALALFVQPVLPHPAHRSVTARFRHDCGLGQQIRLRDDTDHVVVGVDHRHCAHLLAGECVGHVQERRVTGDGERRHLHDIPYPEYRTFRGGWPRRGGDRPGPLPAGSLFQFLGAPRGRGGGDCGEIAAQRGPAGLLLRCPGSARHGAAGVLLRGAVLEVAHGCLL